jgi:8-amino-7-oxononanoate synthase
MTNTIASLEKRLEQRRMSDSERSLSLSSGTDFTSNDYLGQARCVKLRERITQELAFMSDCANGAGGSRLLSGNIGYAEELEDFIAAFHNAESALLFNSGYDANIGLFSAIATRHDTIFYDELAHASIIDGIRLSHATAFKFAHNDLAQLESKLKLAKGNVFIAVESLYSMDGDKAPLRELAEFTRKHDANLIVDEAHATGVFGNHGRGLVNELGLEAYVFARVHTFGKALGVHGAAIVGPKVLRNILVNFARSFIYTTALPLHSLVAVRSAYDEMQNGDEKRMKLARLIAHFLHASQKYPGIFISYNVSPIQSIRIPGNENARKIAGELRVQGFDVRAIFSPTVPEGTERLRICLHSFNTIEQIDDLFRALEKLLLHQDSLCAFA